MKKIYPKKWLELHPYKQTNSVDQYYVGIANEIHKRLYSSTIADAFEEEENIRYTSLCLAAWFEDVISQTGIWQAFTAECRKRYGAYLPFYPIKGDYFPDEINLEDIRFLLWHHIQYLCRGISAINPENPGIEQTAQEIYGLLAEEYETAPENERMQEFLYHSAMGEEDFFRYREILDWFHYQCYFNIENVAQCRDEAERLLDDEKITPEMAETLIYATRTSLTFKGRRNLLSLTSPEWLALIGKAHPEHQLWGKVKARENSCYLLEKEDDEFLYVKDLCSEDEGEFKITKKSLNLSAIRSREVGKSTLICELIYFGNTWWQCGILLGSKNAFQLKSLEYGTVDSVNGAGIDMLHLLLLQQSHYTDGCTEILADGNNHHIHTVQRQHGQGLLVRSVDDKGCGNLFLQTIHPADAHVRTYHFVPQCRKLFCQHVTIIP
ncbi:Protein of uncharacterised function (DUF3843) [Bacteroides uniformis]|uniref:Protein of uncharacterized function (DUF3843) n=1 Tax=Bacteroides uniformis TaxID=820 RepID=A0A174PCK9_BACUN|nr:Protein of uncharacterised function (DUF3843) [Bacteroides uniformis]